MNTVTSVPTSKVVSPSTATEAKYFDLHTSGVGYLSRVRDVPIKRESFLACTISALRGESSSTEYTKFDCRVSGADAKMIVNLLRMQANDQDKKVLIGFVIGDTYPESFVFDDKGTKTTKLVTKGRLLRITFAKVNGVPVDFPNVANESEQPEAQAA